MLQTLEININCQFKESYSCVEHSSQTLLIDKNYKVFCYLCNKSDIKQVQPGENKHKNDMIVNKSKTNQQIGDIYICKEHNSQVIFFCEDCSEDVCKSCFTKHKNHSYAPFETINKNFSSTVSHLLNELKIVKCTTEQTLESVKPVQEFYQNIKNFIDTELKINSNKLFSVIEDKQNFFEFENSKIFKGLDAEVEENVFFLQDLKNRLAEAEKRIGLLNSDLTKIKNSDFEVCLFKKDNSQELSEMDRLINEADKFLNDKFKKIKQKAEESMPIFEQKTSEFNSKMKNFEMNVMKSLQSGISSVNYRIRRFKTFFSYENPKQFENSSICILANKIISLSGLGITGLFVDNLYKKVNSLPLKIEIIEVVQDKKQEIKTIIATKEINLPAIRNIIDPVFPFYLDKSIILQKDRYYYINVKNNGENFVKIWSGSIENESDDSKATNQSQTIICNDTYVKFNFLSAIGQASDFNEFTMGIICDLIYSYSG